MIELDCFHEGEHPIDYNALGLKPPKLSEIDTQKITFFIIDNVQEYIEEGIHYSVIQSGGRDFICNLTYEQVLLLLKDK